MRRLTNTVVVVSAMWFAAPPMNTPGAESPYNAAGTSTPSESAPNDSYYGRTQPAMLPSSPSLRSPPLGSPSSASSDSTNQVSSNPTRPSTIANTRQALTLREVTVNNGEIPPIASDANHGAAALPLTPRGGENTARSATSATRQTPGKALMTVGSSLAIVLGLFFMLAWLTRRAGPVVAPSLPSEVVQVLGRSALSGRQQLNLLRLGNRLLLLSVTATGAETLAEIREKEEVDQIMALLETNQPGVAAATFRGVLSRLH